MKYNDSMLVKIYLLRRIYEVYNKGSDAESKYEHHLEKKKKNKRAFYLSCYDTTISSQIYFF